MKQGKFILTENTPLTDSVYRMRLQGDTSAVTAPGQFVNVQLEGLFLRRPVSVCDLEGDLLTLIYKNVGRGTAQMAGLKPGHTLDLLTGLGNGYDLSLSGNHPVLLGGGVGVPPLFWLARQLLARGVRVSAVLGFNTRNEIFLEKEFREIGVEVTVTTADGSCGVRGFVTDAIPEGCTHFYACGPEPMLRAVYRAVDTYGQFSLEERMGCGFGACMGCSFRTRDGAKRICREGPVFRKEELPWD